MLFFDAFIGNNDRHFYNWGVIVDLRGKKKPRFSPIFDTARGFFWNDSEQKLEKVLPEKNKIDTFMDNYVKKSQPKTSWDSETEINHIKLVQLLKDNYPHLVAHAKNIFNPTHLDTIDTLLKNEFASLFTLQRIKLIQKCLNLRFHILSNIINQ